MVHIFLSVGDREHTVCKKRHPTLSGYILTEHLIVGSPAYAFHDVTFHVYVPSRWREAPCRCNYNDHVVYPLKSIPIIHPVVCESRHELSNVPCKPDWEKTRV